MRVLITGGAGFVGADLALSLARAHPYISDTARLEGPTDWRPQRPARQILADTFEWIVATDAVSAGTL